MSASASASSVAVVFLVAVAVLVLVLVLLLVLIVLFLGSGFLLVHVEKSLIPRAQGDADVRKLSGSSRAAAYSSSLAMENHHQFQSISQNNYWKIP